jgi:hypothetical protein
VTLDATSLSRTLSFTLASKNTVVGSPPKPTDLLPKLSTLTLLIPIVSHFRNLGVTRNTTDKKKWSFSESKVTTAQSKASGLLPVFNKKRLCRRRNNDFGERWPTVKAVIPPELRGVFQMTFSKLVE